MNMSQQFLVSLPMLGDSNFFKSVVYVENHDGDGAKGWIVNTTRQQSSCKIA